MSRPQLDFSTINIRPSTVLTGSYVAAAAIVPINGETLEQYNQLSLYVYLTLGSLTSATLKIEFSTDNVNWVQETIDAVDTSTGIITEKLATRTIALSGNYRIALKTRDRYVRVSAIGTGTVTGSLLQIDAITALDI